MKARTDQAVSHTKAIALLWNQNMLSLCVVCAIHSQRTISHFKIGTGLSIVSGNRLEPPASPS